MAPQLPNIVGIEDLTPEMVRGRLSYDAVSGLFTWKVSPSRGVKAGSIAGHVRTDGYVNIRLFYRFYAAHRLAWFYTHGTWPPIIDHKDGDKANNRLDNLREATKAQNIVNRKPPKGYFWSSRDKIFQSKIVVNGETLLLGRFRTAEAAHAAYLVAHEKHYGEFSFTRRSATGNQP